MRTTTWQFSREPFDMMREIARKTTASCQNIDTLVQDSWKIITCENFRHASVPTSMISIFQYCHITVLPGHLGLPWSDEPSNSLVARHSRWGSKWVRINLCTSLIHTRHRPGRPRLALGTGSLPRLLWRRALGWVPSFRRWEMTSNVSYEFICHTISSRVDG